MRQQLDVGSYIQVVWDYISNVDSPRNISMRREERNGSRLSGKK